MDFHFDWGASHFFTKQLQVGVVGYYFDQVTDDFGAPAALGGFRSPIAANRPRPRSRYPASIDGECWRRRGTTASHTPTNLIYARDLLAARFAHHRYGNAYIGERNGRDLAAAGQP
jgi:hypothetical protein